MTIAIKVAAVLALVVASTLLIVQTEAPGAAADTAAGQVQATQATPAAKRPARA